MRDENSDDTGAGSGWWGVFAFPCWVDDPVDRASSRYSESSRRSLAVHLRSLPFSVEQVLDYFNEAFGKRPFKTDHKSFVYTDRENPDEVAIITVSDLESRLAVALFATGDYGVNYIREFFEAPFFSIGKANSYTHC